MPGPTATAGVVGVPSVFKTLLKSPLSRGDAVFIERRYKQTEQNVGATVRSGDAISKFLPSGVNDASGSKFSQHLAP